MSFIQTDTDTKELISAMPSASSAIVSEDLDLVLMLQFFASWAGEGSTDPPRLNWWSTQLLDEWGGEDLFKRLLPRTFEWALLEATRQVAVQEDRQKRLNLAQPDKVRTLFFWGFGIDEKLEERLLLHKQNRRQPYDVLSFPLDLKQEFEKQAFKEAIQSLNSEISFAIVPEGREIKGKIPESITDAAKNLVSGLIPIPLVDKYPMPFYRMEERMV